jgi:hypothetical protein
MDVDLNVTFSSHPSDEEASMLLSTLSHKDKNPRTIFNVLPWWLPELTSSVLSITSLLCIVIVLRNYEGRLATDLHLPSSLTLNGLIAFVATINRACLLMPVCSAIMQEMWLYFAHEAKKPVCMSRLQDMELFANASHSSMGSVVFIIRTRGHRYQLLA